jgi:Flp pilus assembly protein TadD
MGMRLRSRIRRVELAARVEYSKQLVYGPDDPEAIPYLEASIRRFPDAADLRMMMADACVISRPDRVAPEARKAAELAPGDLPLQVYVGWRLIHHGDVATARECVARVQELAGEDYEPLTDLIRLEAMVTACEGNFEEAEAKLRQTVESEPDNMKNTHTLARFLWLTDRNEEAVATIDEAMWNADGRLQPLLDLRAEITGGSAAGA